MKPGHVDLLVLPEMCLSGYVFNSPISILPYLEAPRIGPTSLLARALATRLGCHVIAGYPELIPSSSSPSSSPTITTDTAPKEMEGEALGVGYNSAVIVSPTGEVVGNYRKTFRFETDKTWAREGDGFQYFDLSEPLGRVALGICMGESFVLPIFSSCLGQADYFHSKQISIPRILSVSPPVHSTLFSKSDNHSFAKCSTMGRIRARQLLSRQCGRHARHAHELALPARRTSHYHPSIQ